MTDSSSSAGPSRGDASFARNIPEWNAAGDDGRRCRVHIGISRAVKPLCVAARDLGFGMSVSVPSYVRQSDGHKVLRAPGDNAFGEMIGGDWENFPIADPGPGPYDFTAESYCRFVHLNFKAYLGYYFTPKSNLEGRKACERSLRGYANVYREMQQRQASYPPPVPVIVGVSAMDFLWGLDRLYEMHGRFPAEIALFAPIFQTRTNGGMLDSAEGIFNAVDAVFRRNKVTNRTRLRAIRCTPEVALVASMFERISAIDVWEWDRREFSEDDGQSDTGRSVERMAGFRNWWIAKGNWRDMYGQQFSLPNLDIDLPELR